mgnify:FL=1
MPTRKHHTWTMEERMPSGKVEQECVMCGARREIRPSLCGGEITGRALLQGQPMRWCPGSAGH